MGATTVCVIGSEVSVPGMTPGTDLVKASSDCTELEADETKSVELTLDSRKSADGVATGKVLLRMTAADGSKDIDLAVPLRLEMARQVDEATRWALIVALLALALLIPAILLVGSNLVLARFTLTSTSRTASKSVRITPTGLHALDGGPLLEPEDFENAGFSGSRRGGRLPLDGTGIVLKARRIFSLQEPQGVAVGPSDQLLVSSFMPYRGSLMNESPAGLGVVDASFVLVSPSAATSTEAQGVLVMVIPDGVDRQGIRDRASRISSTPDWRAVLSELTVQHESAVATERDRLSIRTSNDDLPDSPAEEAPRMPWDDPSDGGHGRTPSQTPRKSRFGVTSKPKKSSIAEPSPSPGTEDDPLPPLPDFLK